MIQDSIHGDYREDFRFSDQTVEDVGDASGTGHDVLDAREMHLCQNSTSNYQSTHTHGVLQGCVRYRGYLAGNDSGNTSTLHSRHTTGAQIATEEAIRSSSRDRQSLHG